MLKRFRHTPRHIDDDRPLRRMVRLARLSWVVRMHCRVAASHYSLYVALCHELVHQHHNSSAIADLLGSETEVFFCFRIHLFHLQPQLFHRRLYDNECLVSETALPCLKAGPTPSACLSNGAGPRPAGQILQTNADSLHVPVTHASSAAASVRADIQATCCCRTTTT